MLLFLSVQGMAQSSFEKIRPIAEQAKGRSIEELHRQLTDGLTTEEDRLRAFYYWITHHISYDVNAWRSRSGNWEKQETEVVLKNRKAVCHGYSNLLNSLCRLSGIPSFLVSGYVKKNNIFINEGHTWNMVFTGGQWKAIDATWGAGGIDEQSSFVRHFDSTYFFTPPEIFLSNHYPFDPAWQLVPYPVRLSDYKKSNWKYSVQKNVPEYHFNDTIAQWLKLDSVARRLESAYRMVRMNPDDKEAKLELSFALTDAAYEESSKGTAILAELYPQSGNKRTTAGRSNIPEQEFRSKLREALTHFEKADSIAATVKPTEPGHREQLQQLRKQLQHNRNVITTELR